MLGDAKHPCDLVGKEEEGTSLRFEVAHAGVGTGACGPAIGEDWEVKCEEREFGFVWEPLVRIERLILPSRDCIVVLRNPVKCFLRHNIKSIMTCSIYLACKRYTASIFGAIGPLPCKFASTQALSSHRVQKSYIIFL